MTKTKKCGHKNCDCKIADDKSYCSESCEKAEKLGTGEKCACGCPK